MSKTTTLYRRYRLFWWLAILLIVVVFALPMALHSWVPTIVVNRIQGHMEAEGKDFEAQYSTRWSYTRPFVWLLSLEYVRVDEATITFENGQFHIDLNPFNFAVVDYTVRGHLRHPSLAEAVTVHVHGHFDPFEQPHRLYLDEFNYGEVASLLPQEAYADIRWGNTKAVEVDYAYEGVLQSNAIQHDITAIFSGQETITPEGLSPRHSVVVKRVAYDDMALSGNVTVRANTPQLPYGVYALEAENLNLTLPATENIPRALRPWVDDLSHIACAALTARYDTDRVDLDDVIVHIPEQGLVNAAGQYQADKGLNIRADGVMGSRESGIRGEVVITGPLHDPRYRVNIKQSDQSSVKNLLGKLFNVKDKTDKTDKTVDMYADLRSCD